MTTLGPGTPAVSMPERLCASVALVERAETASPLNASSPSKSIHGASRFRNSSTIACAEGSLCGQNVSSRSAAPDSSRS